MTESIMATRIVTTSITRPTSCVTALLALGLAAPAIADATGISYHARSEVVEGTRYFVTDIFVEFNEPCGRVLLFYQTTAAPVGIAGGFFHASVPGIPPSVVPAPNNQGPWSVDTHLCIGGSTQVPSSGIAGVTPDWDYGFGVTSSYQPGCFFVVPPTENTSFAGGDLKIRVARFAITESQFNPDAAVHFSARFAVAGVPGTSAEFVNLSLTAPFQLLAGGTTTPGDIPAQTGQCFVADSGGSGGGGGGGLNPPAGVANLNPPSFDFNGDGTFDLMWHHSMTGQTSHWLMDGVARVGGGGFQWSTLPGNVPLGACDAGDDGAPEVFFYNPVSRQVFMWSFIGDQRTATSVLFTETTGWTPVGVGDFTGDGRADVLSRSTSGLVYKLRPLNQTTVYPERTWTTLTSVLTFVTNADIDADGRQDLILRAANGIYWGRRVSSTGFTFMSPITPYAVGAEWTLAGTGDYDGDLDDDILWHNPASGEVRAWRIQDGAKIGGSLVRTGVGPQYRLISTVDTDLDGDDDVVWRNEATGDVFAWRMQDLVRQSGAFVRNVSPLWRVVNP